MLNIFALKNHSLGRIVLIMAFILIFSFLLHDIVPHHHSEELFGSGIQAVFHGNDRKLWYLALLAFIFASTNLLYKWRFGAGLERILAPYSLYWQNLRIEISRIFDPISQALRKGILNPKLCD